MKSKPILKSILTVLISLQFISCTSSSITSDKTRERISIDFDWKFELGDIDSAELENFDDTNWRLLDVPNDWSIEGEYNEKNPEGIAGAFLPTGIE